MKISRLKNISFLLFLFPAFVIAQDDKASLIKKVEGFNHPESIVYDRENDVFYISNMAEKVEGDGFISKVSPDGEILDLEWISGLNDPKGFLLQDDILYVTNNTELVEIDIPNQEISRRVPVESAVSLNDITVSEDGTIFISDSGKSSIYVMGPSGEISEWMSSEELEFPNGLLATEDGLFVSAWGSEEPGNFLKVDMETQEIERVSGSGIGNLDGVQDSGNGSFYISDWATGKIYEIDQEGNQSEILTSEKSSGDILFLPKKNQLVLPMNFQNSIYFYQIN